MKSISMIKSEILRHSVNQAGQELISWKLTYPRYVHSELLTYRLAARSSASSRAIPVEKMIREIENCTAAPEAWGKNQKGMSAEFGLEEIGVIHAKNEWFRAAEDAVAHAKNLLRIGAHKQITNRILEPFMHMTSIFTMGDNCLRHIFKERCSAEAQPEFAVLAYRMLDAYLKSVPKELRLGQWHIPMVTQEELDRWPDESQWEDDLLAISTARCARVSYTAHDKEFTDEENVALYQSLIERGHWSPLEHCATPTPNQWNANFYGWKPLRKFHEQEFQQIEPQNLGELLRSRPEWITL